GNSVRLDRAVHSRTIGTNDGISRLLPPGRVPLRQLFGPQETPIQRLDRPGPCIPVVELLVANDPRSCLEKDFHVRKVRITYSLAAQGIDGLPELVTPVGDGLERGLVRRRGRRWGIIL